VALRPLLGALVASLLGGGSTRALALRRVVSSASYYLIALFMCGVLLWQIVSGNAIGAWWDPRVNDIGLRNLTRSW
jgi:hypothetical protein